MRYTVCIVKGPVPEEDDRAWAHLDAIRERCDDVACLPPDTRFLELIDRLAARFPCSRARPDDSEDAARWSDGALRHHAGHALAVLGLLTDRVDECMPFIVAASNALGLVVFDEQQGRIHRPPAQRHVRTQALERVKVTIAGTRDGFTKAQSARLLAPLFKRSEEEVLRLLAMPAPVVKSGVTRAESQKYVAALERCGCVCVLREDPMEASPADHSPIASCRTMAEAGDSQAQFDLGCMHYNSDDRDWEQALCWWRRAAEQGHAAAQSNLAWLYFAGEHVPQDLVQSLAWARLAADIGLAGAQFFLGERYARGEGVDRDAAQAVAWFRKAAAQGHAPAQHKLGVMLERGMGTPPDPACAARWYRRAALQGYAASQYNLAVMHAEGRGVAQDFREAAEWYRPAAEQGHANAQFNLALAYRAGEGVPQDDTQAAHWFSRCAEHGDAEALSALGGCYFNGTGVPQDHERAGALFRQAAAAGHAGAQAALAMMPENGTCRPDDPVAERTWLH